MEYLQKVYLYHHPSELLRIQYDLVFGFKDITKISIIFHRVNVKFSDMYTPTVIVDFSNRRMLSVKCLRSGYA